MREVIWVPRISDVDDTAKRELRTYSCACNSRNQAIVAYGENRAVASIEGLAGPKFQGADPEATAKHVKAMLKHYHGTNSGITLGRCSVLSYLRSKHMEHRYPFADNTRSVFLSSYTGGLVKALHCGRFGNVTKYDIRRAYCWAMLQKMPVGAGVHWKRNLDYKGPEALYDTAWGWKWGYDLAPDDIWQEVITWRDWVDAHGPFVSRCMAMDGDDGEALAKMLVNALYGKHGESAVTKRIPAEDAVGLKGWSWDDALEYAYGKEEIAHRNYHAPHWAGLITARVRGKVKEAIGWGDAVLCHVDMILAQKRVPVGQSIGDWRKEEQFRWVRVLDDGLWVGRLVIDNTDEVKSLVLRLPGVRVCDQHRFWINYCKSRGWEPGTGMERRCNGN